MVEDVRFALRGLRRVPVFAGVSTLTLALAIGLNTALFSLVHDVLLRPLPFDAPDEIVSVRSTFDGARREFTSFTDFSDWRTRARGFSHMAAVRGGNVNVTTAAGAQQLRGALVSEDFFALFRVQPALGRAFLPVEHRPGQGQVALISHRLWVRHFGGDPTVVGSAILLNREPHTVVGVLPDGFTFPDDAEVWRPLTLAASAAGRRVDSVRVFARLRPGVDLRLADGEMAAIARELAERHPATNAGWGTALTSLHGQSTERVRNTLVALWGAVLCVLLVACANIGSLLLARGVKRRPELAVRVALGATRGRLLRPLLTEALALAVFGGLGGILVGSWSLVVLRDVAPLDGARLASATLDVPMLAFTAGLSLVAGLLTALAPVATLSRSRLLGALASESRLSPASRHHRLMNGLAAAQFAVSLLLLVGAGLLVQTLERLYETPLGFKADRLLTFYVTLPEREYRSDTSRARFYLELLDRIRQVPGVDAASAINALYIHWAQAYMMPARIEGRPEPDASAPPDVHVRIVDPAIHQVLGIAVRRGRPFSERDGAEGPLVAVINEAMARRYFAHEDPIGQRIAVRSLSPAQPLWHEIVGVADDVRQQGLDAAALPEVQVLVTQSAPPQMAILARTAIDPASVVPAIRAELRSMDPHLPLTFVQTMDEVVAASVANRRAGMRLLSIFSGLALFLTLLGLYGVMATAVGERTREIAVRATLGATPSALLRMVVGRALGIAGAGLAAGVALSAAATRSLEPLLFGVTRFDAPTYAAAAVALLAVAVVGAGLPARRAARVDPAVALRR